MSPSATATVPLALALVLLLSGCLCLLVGAQEATQYSDFVGVNLRALLRESQSNASSLRLSLTDVSGILTNPKAKVQHRKNAWKFISRLYYDPYRYDNAEMTFQTAQGVIVKSSSHHGRQHHHGKTVSALHNVVLVTIATYSVDFSSSEGQPLRGDYIPMLMNWLCYAHTHGLKGIVYALDISDRDYSSSDAFLRQRADAIKGYHLLAKYVKTVSHGKFSVLPFPESTFWSLLANRTGDMAPRGQYPPRADYIGVVPHFRRHGAVLMLVPWLELLVHGCSLIFLDVDVSMVRNPIPWLTLAQQRVDLSFSKEIRDCRLPNYPTRYFRFGIKGRLPWGDRMIEPNTGVSFIVYRNRTLEFMRSWLKDLVETNIANDQKAIDFQVMRKHYSNDCNFAGSSGMATKQLSLCLYDEYVFQNGMVALHCATDKNRGEREEYAVGMQASPLHGPIPVLLHVNYVGDKRGALINHGLWLYRDNIHELYNEANRHNTTSSSTVAGANYFCYRYNNPAEGSHGLHGVLSHKNSGDTNDNMNTHLASHWLAPGYATWDAEIDHATSYMQNVTSNLPLNGTFFRFSGEHSPSICINGLRRRIANDRTLELLGYNETTMKIEVFTTPVLRDLIPDGPDIDLAPQ
jgi:hypothetical protein